MREIISPAAALTGSITLPGDKSISHRYALLGSIARGVTRVSNYSGGEDCQSTLACIQALGARVEVEGTELLIYGEGLDGLQLPASMLDAGNSGSTIRMLSGILAGQPFPCRIGGDQSLSRRPMDRIIRPLTQMGASVQARDGCFPPLEIRGGILRPIDYTLPVASAQVKSCILLAGLYAEGRTTVREPVRTRDHTEIALREFGASVEVSGRAITVDGRPELKARELIVPGDLSSAAFFIVAALLVPGSRITIQGVGLNPTRAALLDFLTSIGAPITVSNLQLRAGEPVGDLEVRHGPVRGGVIEKDLTAALIDEIPVLLVLGAVSEEGLTVRDAGELRYKETDRIATVADNFRRIGVSVEVLPDGLRVPGRQQFRPAVFDSFGDHRIAMAFAVAALRASGPSAVEGAEAASVSFPGFFETLRGLAG